LEDWTITLKVVRFWELPDDLGQTEKNAMRDAVILLRDGNDLPPRNAQWFANIDMEVTLVHELLHLRFPNWRNRKDEEEKFRSDEAGVEATAQALVRIYRTGKVFMDDAFGRETTEG
jgi:hypothetical protein